MRPLKTTAERVFSWSGASTVWRVTKRCRHASRNFTRTSWRGPPDVYHHGDGDDAWRAIDTMRKCELPEPYHATFLGDNARKLYEITDALKDLFPLIASPNSSCSDWWPTDEEAWRAAQA